jgi:hypothetical protein
MATFTKSSLCVEAFRRTNDQLCHQGVAIIDYGLLIAELLQRFRNEDNFAQIVTMVPQVCPLIRLYSF